MADPTQVLGIHHLGLTVPDIEATSRFFIDAIGFKVVGGDPGYPSTFVSNGHVMLTIWGAEDPATATPFNRRRNIGLHHVALQAPDIASLPAIFAAVEAQLGVTVEFPPGPVRPGAASRHFICAIPGGIRLEVFAAAPAS